MRRKFSSRGFGGYEGYLKRVRFKLIPHVR